MTVVLNYKFICFTVVFCRTCLVAFVVHFARSGHIGGLVALVVTSKYWGQRVTNRVRLAGGWWVVGENNVAGFWVEVEIKINVYNVQPVLGTASLNAVHVWEAVTWEVWTVLVDVQEGGGPHVCHAQHRYRRVILNPCVAFVYSWYMYHDS